MNIKKISGTLAVVIAMLSLSGAANADHEASCAPALQSMVIDTAYALACEESYGTLGYTPGESLSTPWPGNNPLWQHRAGKLKNADESTRDSAGCEVHAKLATKLYAVRPDDGTPPQNQKKSNLTRGAANALDPLNLKFETAVTALESFKSSVDSSRPNLESTVFPALPDGTNSKPAQADWEKFLKDWADSTIYQVQACGHTL